jgi:hypothetical protein
MTKNLDCGHEPSPHGTLTTGTGHFHDYELCWDCMNKLELFYAGQSDTYTAYVDGKAEYVTTWPGGKLARIYSARTRWNNFAGKLLHIKAVEDSTGIEWYGTGPGKGSYIRLHRRKVS